MLRFEGKPVNLHRYAMSAGIRGIETVDGKLWLMQKDALKELGMSKEDAEKEIGEARDSLSDGRALISEGTFYRLLLRSKRREAEEFSDWIFDEVLPSLARDGYYRM